MAEAEASVRAKGWIERSGRLDDSWYEIVSTLVYGSSLAYLYLNAPDSDETRALVAASRGLAFRIVLRGERVRIDEVRPDAAEPGAVRNVNSGQVSGSVSQFRDQHGSVSHTVINGGTGPTHTGPGPLYAGPSFHGGVNNYVADRNSGGIHQNLGAHGQDEADD